MPTSDPSEVPSTAARLFRLELTYSLPNCVVGCQTDNKVGCSIQSLDRSFGSSLRLAVSTPTPLSSLATEPISQGGVCTPRRSLYRGCLFTIHPRFRHVYNSAFHRLGPGRVASKPMSRAGNSKTGGRRHRGSEGPVQTEC